MMQNNNTSVFKSLCVFFILLVSFLAIQTAIAGPPQTTSATPLPLSYASVLAGKPFTALPSTLPSHTLPVTPKPPRVIVMPPQPQSGFWLWTAPHWHYPG